MEETAQTKSTDSGTNVIESGKPYVSMFRDILKTGENDWYSQHLEEKFRNMLLDPHSKLVQLLRVYASDNSNEFEYILPPEQQVAMVLSGKITPLNKMERELGPEIIAAHAKTRLAEEWVRDVMRGDTKEGFEVWKQARGIKDTNVALKTGKFTSFCNRLLGLNK